MKKSVLAIALAVLMAVSLLTVGAMAASSSTQTENSVAKYENAGGDTTYFDTVGEAISASNAGGGGTITLLDNAELKANDTTSYLDKANYPGYGYCIYVRADLTLDLGGYTLTCNEFYGLTVYPQIKYSLQGTTQGNGLTGGVPPVRFSM